MNAPIKAKLADELRYTKVAISLHWTIAFFIIFNLATGFFMERLPPIVIVLHISSGMTVLALTIVRVVWRLTHSRPPYPTDYKPWERHLANLVHLCLYALMIGMPLSGWALISANPPPNSAGAAVEAQELAQEGRTSHANGAPPIWFLFTLPLIEPIQEIGSDPSGLSAQRAVHARFNTAHFLGGWSMLILALLHVSGALKHQFVDGHRELARMGIGRQKARDVT